MYRATLPQRSPLSYSESCPNSPFNQQYAGLGSTRKWKQQVGVHRSGRATPTPRRDPGRTRYLRSPPELTDPCHARAAVSWRRSQATALLRFAKLQSESCSQLVSAGLQPLMRRPSPDCMPRRWVPAPPGPLQDEADTRPSIPALFESIQIFDQSIEEPRRPVRLGPCLPGPSPHSAATPRRYF